MTQLIAFEENTPEHSAYLNIPKKRVHYKKPTYNKSYKNDVIHSQTLTTNSKPLPNERGNTTIKDDNLTWGRMKELYQILANYFPYPILQPIKTLTPHPNPLPEERENTLYIDTGIIRTYKSEYVAEKYLYQGDDGITRIYKGQEFTIWEAEIIGTEDLGINERLFVHELLIEYLDKGYQIEQLNMWISEIVNWFLQGFTAENMTIFLLLLAKCPNIEGLR